MVIKKLKERIKSLSRNVNEDMVKNDIEEIETINIELDHKVQSKDSGTRFQEQGLTVTALKDELRKLKGKDLADNVVCKHTIDPEMLKIDVEYLNPRLLNNRSVHSDYRKHTQEEAAILKEIVEHGKSLNPLNESLDSACKYTKQIQELLIIVEQTCPSINNSSEKLVAVTPKNKDKSIRFTKPVTSSGNTNTKTASSSNLVSNKPMLSSTGCNGCILFDNHDLCVLDFINDVNARTKSKSVKKSSKRKVWKPTGKVFTNIGYTWRPTGRTFTIVGNVCPLTRITTTVEVPLRKLTALESDTPKPVVLPTIGAADSRRGQVNDVDHDVKPFARKTIDIERRELSEGASLLEVQQTEGKIRYYIKACSMIVAFIDQCTWPMSGSKAWDSNSQHRASTMATIRCSPFISPLNKSGGSFNAIGSRTFPLPQHKEKPSLVYALSDPLLASASQSIAQHFTHLVGSPWSRTELSINKLLVSKFSVNSSNFHSFSRPTKAQSQEKDTVIKKLKERIKSLSGKINEDKIKKDLEEIETINIELDHRSVEISDLNASLQEKVLVITALKDDLRKLKGKALVDNAVTKHTIDPDDA
ncbi:hypothetical protein Tco_0866209 [Tanacetum coccineum]